MKNYVSHNITWESDPCVILIDDHPALFNVTWECDYDDGYLCTAEFVETHIGGKIFTRDDLVAMSTESAVADVERRAAEHMAINWREHLEAAE